MALPSIHFMCQHSYHQHCLPDNERECIKCKPKADRAFQRKQELMLQSYNHEVFFKELQGSQDRFSVIARYFSRGLFSNK